MVSGKCGRNVKWTLDNGTLIIDGTGAMDDYVYDYESSDANSPWYNFRNEIKKIIICDGVTSIGNFAFSECESLTTIKIPDGVTFIGEGAFSDCESLTTIKIPDSVTFIGDWAFSWCYGLTEIKIPDSVTSIGKHAFNRCESLKKIHYPAGRGFEEILSEDNDAELVPY